MTPSPSLPHAMCSTSIAELATMGSNGSRESIFRSPRDAVEACSNFSKELGDVARPKQECEYGTRVCRLVPPGDALRPGTDAIAEKGPPGRAIGELRRSSAARQRSSVSYVVTWNTFLFPRVLPKQNAPALESGRMHAGILTEGSLMDGKVGKQGGKVKRSSNS